MVLDDVSAWLIVFVKFYTVTGKKRPP